MNTMRFYNEVNKQMESLMASNKEAFEKTAVSCAHSIESNRVIHIFGTGHSQMFAMEIFYRAGGLVPVNALLSPHYALFPKSKLSTIQERVEGFSNEYLALENISKEDTLIIVSISGRNPSAVDMALEAKKIGMTVVALTSLSFSTGVTSRHSSKKLLKDVADIVIDIPCIKGDAVLSHKNITVKYCGTSTVLGMTALETIIAGTIDTLADKGIEPPIYVSSNLDEGDDINAAYIKKYSPMISCL